jgi:hypothetical protein
MGMEIEDVVKDCMKGLKNEIEAIIIDIELYLNSDVPLESHAFDIDQKLYDMKIEILRLFY